MTGCRRDRRQPADPGAVLALSEQGAAWRFRHLADHRAPGAAGHDPRLPRHHGAGPAGAVRRHGVRRAARRGRRHPSRPLAGPGGPLRLAARLFDAGVLARAGRAAAVLRQARLGRGSGAPRCRLRRHRADRHRPDHHRQPDRRRERRVLERAQPPRAARLHPRLSLARLCRAHDAQLHARPAQAGIRAGDAGQGIVAVPRRVGSRARQCLGAAGHRHRADASAACWRARC